MTGTFLCLALLALGSSASRAVGQVIHPQVATTTASQNSTPFNDHNPEIKLLFSNLAGDRTKLYDGSNGYFVSGLHNLLNSQKQDIAIPFVANFDATIASVNLALQHYPYGANQATVAITADRKGLPGVSLAKTEINNLEAFGAGCCKLAVWKLATQVQVTQGTQYWVVVTTNKISAGTVNSWDFVSDGKPGTFAVQLNSGGWSLLLPADGNPPPTVS